MLAFEGQSSKRTINSVSLAVFRFHEYGYMARRLMLELLVLELQISIISMVVITENCLCTNVSKN